MNPKVWLWGMKIAGMLIWCSLFGIYTMVSGDVIPQWGWILIACAGATDFGCETLKMK